MPDDILVRVEGVSKKFCRNLKRSLWYGLKDIGSELLGRSRSATLRKEEFWALNDVNFELRRGECLGLIGHNGSGKSTLLKMLNGLIKPDKGRIAMKGRVGALIELGTGFNPVLTGRDNIYNNGAVLGFTKKEIDAKFDSIVEFSEIGEFLDTPVQNYSSGMKVRLGFAVAAHMESDIMLLDEVLAVGDMHFQTKCLNELGRMRKEGVAFILVSHAMMNVRRHCNRVLYLNKGTDVFIGDTNRGIQLYEEEMAAKNRSAPAAIPPKMTEGSKKISIEKVFFSDQNGRECKTIGCNDALTVCIDYKGHFTVPIPFKVEVTIRNQMGVLHQFISDGLSPADAAHPDRGRIVCSFDYIAVNSAQIIFNIVLWDADCTELYDWKNAKLNVNTVEGATGICHFPGRIELRSA